MRKPGIHSRFAAEGFALLVVLGVLVAGVPALGASVRYVGAIEEGPRSPTAVVVTEAEIAILEPFQQQLVLYSAGGVLNRRIDFGGEARGLVRLDAGIYLFCDRDAGRIAEVGLVEDTQGVFLADVGDPTDLVWDGSALHVLDARASRIVVCDRGGSIVRQIFLTSSSTGPQAWYAALAFDAAREIYYTLDQVNSRIEAWSATGEHLGSFGSFGSHEGEISRGGGITCDADGWVYVADRYQGRVAIFDRDWRFVLNVDPLVMGQPRLALPTGVAVDAGGFLYVTATEGASLKIFQVDKTDAPADVPIALPLRPAYDDSVTAVRPRFVASVRGPAAATSLLVDFRLASWPDSTGIVDEISGLAAQNITRLDDVIFGEATWNPGFELTVGERYGWQARARTNEITGGWSAFIWFEVVPDTRRLRLHQNAPNPFNPQTVIAFELPGDGHAELQIYDVRGHLVDRTDLSGLGAGPHEVVWQGRGADGRALATGLYFYRLVTGSESLSRKMVLIR